MKNDEKIDINFSQDISSDDISQEEKDRLILETYERYVNIAEHMKQWEDIDKYYYRAYNTLFKNNDDGKYTDMIKTINFKRIAMRAEGKVSLYKEACHVRDTATTEQDYYAAQTIFLRIAKYEVRHKVPKKWVSKELFEAVEKCADSAEQAEYCEKKAIETANNERRQSLIASIIVIVAVIALLVFSRTTESRRILASIYEMTGSYTGAYQKYNAVYERTGEQEAFDKYVENRYKAAKKAIEKGDPDGTAYIDMKNAALANYKDSQEILTQMEIDRIKEAALGDIVHYARIDWRILDIEDDKVLLIKNNALGSTPFNNTSGACTWADSSIRQWLNGEFLDDNYFDVEKSKVIDTEVEASTNSYYEGVDAGESTTDKLFLLSIDEVEKYVDVLHGTLTCWWLRTPGATEGSMAFVYMDKEVMAAGYPASSPEITIKPAMWLSIK